MLLNKIFLQTFLFLSAIFIFSCGGVSEFQNGPVIDPVVFLTGESQGHRVVRDRNYNVKFVADVNRSCRPASELAGECEDTVIYFNPPGTVKESFKFQITYDESLKLWLKIEGKKTSLAGRIYGSGLHLTGELPVPGEIDKSIPVETRWDRISSDEKLSLQKDIYFFMGIHTGTVETIWEK